MTLLKNNLSLKIFLIVLIILGGVAHIYLMPSSEAQKNITTAPRHLIARESSALYPPAFSFDNNGKIHYLGKEEDGIVKYLVLSPDFEVKSSSSIVLEEGVVIEYIFSLEQDDNNPYFVVVGRKGRHYQPYLLFRGEEEMEMIRLPFTVQESMDVGGVVFQGSPLLVFVEREQGEYQIKMWEAERETEVIYSSDGFIGLPRIALSEEGKIHVIWKGQKGAIGIAQYAVFDPGTGLLSADYPRELGPAAISFGEISGQPRRFQEDPGGRILFDKGGNLFISWTDAFWEPLLGIHRASIHLEKISPAGETLGRWEFSGNDGFSVFPEIYIDSQGNPAVLFEDFSNSGFNLMLSAYDSEIGDFSSPNRFSTIFGSHRLVAAENSKDGAYAIFWRMMDGADDVIWARTSKEAGVPGWADRWQIWYLDEGPGGVIIETAMIVLFSLIGAIATLARNSLTVALIAVLLYIFQSYRILPKMNFFLFCGLLLGLIVICREFFPLFYSPPVSPDGLQLFSALITTLIIIFLARKQWFKGGEEFVYLGYTLLWIFLDSFIIFLAISPGNFSP